jgi:hypothetical protein
MDVAKTFYMTWAGFSLTMASGIISASSSALIIYIILGSAQKLSTTYHRIMSFMSLCNMIASVAMGLATIPMPKDSIYKFDGPMLGTFSTCTAQAYFVFWGGSTGMFLNLFLSWYYVCDIAFKIKPETIQRRLEPIFYVISVSSGIYVPTIFLYYEHLNAHPFDPYCSLGSYPFSCNDLEGTIYEGLVECEPAATKGPFGDLFANSGVVIGFAFLGIAVAMMIIIYTAFQNERQKKEDEKRNPDEDNELDPDTEQYELMISLPQTDNSVMENGKSLNKFRYKRVIVFQALLYILAFSLTWIFNYIPQWNGKSDDTVYYALKSWFIGFQGFWNMIIFLHQKTYLVLKYDETASFWKALKTVIVAPKDVPEVYICNIDHLSESLQQIHDNNTVAADPPVGSEYDGISFDTPSGSFGLSFGLSSAVDQSKNDTFTDEGPGKTTPHVSDRGMIRRYGT